MNNRLVVHDDPVIFGEQLDQGAYTVIKHHIRHTKPKHWQEEQFYMESTAQLMQFLQVLGKLETDAFDFDKDQDVDTMDLLQFIRATQNAQPDQIDFNTLEVAATFGEGNSELKILKVKTDNPDGETPLFAWLHRTPYDEPGEPNDTFNLNSFDLDVIYKGRIETFTYLRI